MIDFPTGGQNVLASLKKCPNAIVVINIIMRAYVVVIAYLEINLKDFPC